MKPHAEATTLQLRNASDLSGGQRKLAKHGERGDRLATSRHKVVKAPTVSHRTVNDVAELIDIVSVDRNIMVLKRSIPSELANLAQSDLANSPVQLTITCQPGESILSTVSQSLPSPVAQAFANDVQYWAQVFADITECTTIGIRITTTDRAMCPRFHIDRVVLRGVMTYVGPGTQYVANRDVDRSALGPPTDNSPPIENDDAVIEMAQAGDLVLLKGEAWPGNEGGGAVHRSPPVPEGVNRLVVTFDALQF